jgi:hypothetical protein
LSAPEVPALRYLTARLPADRCDLDHHEPRITPPLDPAIALLDGWACVGHILGFYNDRLVNEHYLRTCRHRRSAVELARLVGYAPRSGLAADVHLAFTLDDLDKEAELAVPAGTRAYSQPGPGETMEPFETSEALTGRPSWTLLRPRLTAPARITPRTGVVDLKGIATGLAKGSTLVITVGGELMCRTAASVEARPSPDGRPDQDRTRVWLSREPPLRAGRPPVTPTSELLEALLKAPAAFTAGRERLSLKPADVFTPDSYAAYGLVESSYPGLREKLGAALGGTAHADPTGDVVVYAMRVTAGLHGSTAGPIPWRFDRDRGVVTEYRDWNVDGTNAADTDSDGGNGNGSGEGAAAELLGGAATPLGPREIALDGVYDTILPGSLVVVGDPPQTDDAPEPLIDEVEAVRTESRVNFNLPARLTVLTLKHGRGDDRVVENVRRTVVHAQSERLDLVEVPITDDVCAGELELDGYFDGLHPGRRVIVTGERTDLLPRDLLDTGQQVTGVAGTELVIITKVEHRVAAADADHGQATADTVHSVVTFAEPGLQYCYRRESVRLYGNVAHATHGESRTEVLGGGDASRPLQTFPLKQGPLTYVSAATPSGARSTLEVRVDDLRWDEAPHAADISPDERRYIVQAEDDGRTAVTFGLGARLPTGPDNVRAQYRTGLGRGGNVRSGQVTVLATRPNGVIGVTNPLAATGGVDRDDADAVRRRAPIGLGALDRLVSATDIEDFARAFAGIGKASVAAWGPADYTLTVAAADDALLTAGSDLIRDLRGALARFGDLDNPADGGPLTTRGLPRGTVDVRIRTALLLGIRARIKLAPDHVWEVVRRRLGTAAFAEFGFAAADIGAVPRAGRAMAVLQAVRGVDWVDLLAFGTIPIGTAGTPATPAEVADAARALLDVDPAAIAGLPPDPPVGPTEIAYLSPGAPGTLLLELAEEEAPG